MHMSYKQIRTLRLLRYVLCIRTFVVELEEDDESVGQIRLCTHTHTHIYIYMYLCVGICIPAIRHQRLALAHG